MSAPKCLLDALDETRYQLTQVLDGLEGDQWAVKSHEQAMSPKETLQHLADCYTACAYALREEKYDFGSFRFETDNPTVQLAKMLELRDEAVAKALETNTEKAHHCALEYIVLHDCYHVGQLATIRLAINPEWNAYSIYRF